jgi:hypothetical protein
MSRARSRAPRAALFCRVLFFATLAAAFAAQGCDIAILPEDDCELGNAVYSTDFCDGSVVKSIVRDACDVSSTQTVIDCADRGEDCVDGKCVLVGERCPPGAVSVCRDEGVHRCVGDRVASRSDRPCTGNGLTCHEVPAEGGRTNAECALEPGP